MGSTGFAKAVSFEIFPDACVGWDEFPDLQEDSSEMNFQIFLRLSSRAVDGIR
jgi:hypothetical protein